MLIGIWILLMMGVAVYNETHEEPCVNVEGEQGTRQ